MARYLAIFQIGDVATWLARPGGIWLDSPARNHHRANTY
jgi:hypothetical protein